MAQKPLPSLNAIRAFETTARHLNYKLASSELNVTPAAVKQLVVKLEEFVGAKLLIRQGQGLALTPTGSQCLPKLSEGFALLQSGISEIHTEKKQNQLILSVETSIASTWLVPKLEQFRTLHPEISVLVDSTQRIAVLENDSVDIAIRYGVDSPAHYERHLLFHDYILPACSPSLLYDFSDNKILCLTDLLDHIPLIHWDMSAHTWAENSHQLYAWENWTDTTSASSTGNTKLSFNDYGQAVQAAIAGQGVLLASQPLLDQHFEQNLLVPIGNHGHSTKAAFDIVTLSNDKKRYDIDAFITWITNIPKQDSKSN